MRADIMRYPIEVFWSDEDEGFSAIAPDLPGASAACGARACRQGAKRES